MPNFDFNKREEKTLKELCSQNRYKDSKEYYSYTKDFLHYIKQILKQYLTMPLDDLITLLNIKFSLIKDSDILLLVYALKYSFPVYHIDSRLLYLFEKTDSSKIPAISNLFIENAIFLLPRKNPYNIRFIISSSSIPEIKTEFSNTLFNLVVFNSFHEHTNKGVIYTYNYANRNADNLTLHPVLFQEGVDRLPVDVFYPVQSLIWQIFLYMSTTYNGGIEEIITPTNIHNTTPKKNRKFGLLTPPTIGKECSEYVRKQKAQYSEHKNSHASPITHWRRGHWRNQPKTINGEKGKELIWIRPTIINPLASA